MRNDPIETGVVFNSEDGTELFNGVAEGNNITNSINIYNIVY